jgi:serine/threonine protein kinase
LAWTSGRLPKVRIQALDVHVDGCEHCQALIAEALRASGDADDPRPREETFADNELVAGRYRVVRFLARGGMGEVYEVYDLWLKDTVALKTLLASIADDASALARLKAEVLLARRISHPNVCRVYDLGFHDKRSTIPGMAGERVAFLTMEFLPGETLRTRLRRTGRFTLQEARPIAAQMMAGMADAHSAGIIHRDFKSDNVMLVEEEGSNELRVVVTDFGLARSSLLMFAQPLTSSSHRALGTLDYMAPEQLEGKPATQQSDIYALGVVLFEMLTGKLPFEGDSLVARALRRVQSEPPRPSSMASDIDDNWDRVILKCLARDPAERFDRVSDIGALLEASTTPSPRSRRKRWLVALTGVAFALLAILVLASQRGSKGESIPSAGTPPLTAPSGPRRAPASPDLPASVTRTFDSSTLRGASGTTSATATPAGGSREPRERLGERSPAMSNSTSTATSRTSAVQPAAPKSGASGPRGSQAKSSARFPRVVLDANPYRDGG